MFLLLLAACPNPDDDYKTTGETDPTVPDTAECADDTDCGADQICEAEVCVDGDRNNAPDEATPILWEETLSGVINPDGDIDYYRFEAEGGEYLRALTALVDDTEDYDTVLTIREANGKTVTSADAYATGTSVTGEDAVAFAYLAEAGTYTIAVEDIGTASGGVGYGHPEYGYQLTLEEWGDATAETDDADAPRLNLDLSDERIWYSAGVLVGEAGDADYIGIAHIQDGDNLYVDGNEDISGSDLAPLVRLWDPAGNLLGEKANVGPDEYLFYPRLAEGDYVIEVTDAGGDGGANAWMYTHVIVRPDYDGYAFEAEAEPNADAGTASTLPFTTYQNSNGDDYQQAQGLGWIDTDGDEDWFLVDETYTDGGLVLCLMSGFYGSTVAPTVAVYDGDGNLLASDAGSATAYPTANLDNVSNDGTPRYLRVTGDVSGPGAWYRFYVYVASFDVADYGDGGYGCP